MIQIIKNGIYNSATCSNCECEFAFTADELDAENQIDCPQCGETLTVPTEAEQK